ncbi:MAG: serine hydroxymethyltransferase [Planctomycetes bacterium]|nr:serine hydroxymethyltransferase [Planctomycetota bacterium]
MLDAQDPELAALLERERQRQTRSLTLIASENHCSPAVREACSSVLTDKYAEGYPGRRYYGGCAIADQVEELAAARALRMFPGMAHANVQPHSGTSANWEVLSALAGSGGRILGVALAEGGHLSHGHPVSHTGKMFEVEQYGTNHETGLIDYDSVRDLARKFRPKVLIAGASSYPRELDYAVFAEIAREVDAVLLADIAHPAGLMAAGVIGSPVGHADVLTMTTHKTLRGPRGGLILCSEELRKQIDSSVFPGGQGGPLMHQIAAKAVAFAEALAPEFKTYQQAVKDNAAHLAACLAEGGMKIVTGGTDTHMVVVDLRGTGATGADVESRCFEAGISLNKNMVPGDPESPRVTSGFRVGTAAATTRGLGKDQFAELASIIAEIVRGTDPASLKARVATLCDAHPAP